MNNKENGWKKKEYRGMREMPRLKRDLEKHFPQTWLLSFMKIYLQRQIWRWYRFTKPPLHKKLHAKYFRGLGSLENWLGKLKKMLKHALFINNTFITNARLKLAKNKQKLSNTLRMNFCYLKNIHIFHPRHHPKIIGRTLKKHLCSWDYSYN